MFGRELRAGFGLEIDADLVWPRLLHPVDREPSYVDERLVRSVIRKFRRRGWYWVAVANEEPRLRAPADRRRSGDRLIAKSPRRLRRALRAVSAAGFVATDAYLHLFPGKSVHTTVFAERGDLWFAFLSDNPSRSAVVGLRSSQVRLEDVLEDLQLQRTGKLAADAAAVAGDLDLLREALLRRGQGCEPQ